MEDLQKRRKLVFGIMAVALAVALLAVFLSPSGTVVKNIGGDANYEGLTLTREIDISDDLRFTFENRIEIFHAAIEAHAAVGEVDYDQYLALASDANMIGDLVTAREAYEAYIQGVPTDFSVWNSYAKNLARMRDLDLAEEAFRQAIELNPQESYMNDYIVFMERNNQDGSRDEDIVEWYNLAIDVHGQQTWMMLGLGRWYMDQGDCNRSLDHYKVADQLDPESEAVQKEYASAREACK